MATKRNNKKKRLELYLLVLASAVLLIGLSSQLLAKKPIKPGDQPGGDVPVCVKFDSGSVGVRGDGLDLDGDDLEDDYCDDKTTKVSAVIVSAGALSLNPNNQSWKYPDGMRKLFVNLGRPLELSDGTIFQDTDEFLDEASNIDSYNVTLMCRLNDWPNSDLRDMPWGGDPLFDNGHMRMTISLRYKNGATGRLIISYEPNLVSNEGCDISGNGKIDITR
ncbi:MAG: hypothetical protein ACYS14_10460, partial [Planctomycetota bacterium]